MRSSKPILLVEDDDVDAMGVKRALKDLSVSNPMVRAGNGEEALVYLINPKNELPCIILCDVNMPRMTGVELLREIKRNEKLKPIPIVMLTSSRDENDKLISFNLGVAGYIVKPVDYRELLESIRVLNLYWTLCETPE